MTTDMSTPKWREELARRFLVLVDDLQACNRAVAMAERDHDDVRLEQSIRAQQAVIEFIAIRN